MGYIVVHRGETTERAFRDYLLLVSRRLLKRGVGLDRVPRTPADGHPHRWLYVSADEAEAKELAKELRRYTEDNGWEVRPFEGTPEQGPLCPISVELGVSRTGFGFGLDPITKRALRLRYPEAVQYQHVRIDQGPGRKEPTVDELRAVVTQLLPLLTSLGPEQLAAFGGFEVVNPVAHEAVVPFTPYPPADGVASPVNGPTHSGTAGGPVHCTSGSSD
jgi:hypothetical protein